MNDLGDVVQTPPNVFVMSEHDVSEVHPRVGCTRTPLLPAAAHIVRVSLFVHPSIYPRPLVSLPSLGSCA